MLIPKGYTDIPQIEDYLLHSIMEYFKPQVSHWIAQMERFVETMTGRVFIADTTASERIYETEKKQLMTVGRYSASPRDLQIDECVEITELTIDDEVIDADDYITYPANATLLKIPITRIKLKDDSGLVFTVGEQNIEVKAKWGYSVACPDDIAFATMILVVGIINYSGDMEGEVKSETIGSYSVTYKDEKDWMDFNRAKEILQNYTKIII